MKTVYSFADEKMTKTISALKNEYASIRAGRASAADRSVVLRGKSHSG